MGFCLGNLCSTYKFELDLMMYTMYDAPITWLNIEDYVTLKEWNLIEGKTI